MKVACFVNPLVQARGPCFNFGWVETLANLLQPLRRDARCECMLIAGGWFKDWASQNQKGALLTGLRTVWIDELALYRRLRALGELPTALDQTAYQVDDAEHPALRVIAESMARDANGFEPDIIIGFAGQANYLARLWPSALRLHIERGHFGRDPYPFSMYFDHVGTHARSAVARAGGLKLAYPLTSDGRTLVSAFRSQMTAAFDGLDPFRTQALRKRFDRLCLLPLQVSNEFSFDGLVNYRTQFEYLYDVLAAAPKDVAVIVTEHPNGDPVLRRSGSCANIDMLRRTFPNIVFLDEFRQCQSPSQLLVPRVDGVWTVSSSVGYQALLFSRLLGSPSSTELSHVADATTLEDFFRSARASQVDQCRRRQLPRLAAGALPGAGVVAHRRPLVPRLSAAPARCGAAGKRPGRCVRADGGRRSPHGRLDRQDPAIGDGTATRRGRSVGR